MKGNKIGSRIATIVIVVLIVAGAAGIFFSLREKSAPSAAMGVAGQTARPGGESASGPPAGGTPEGGPPAGGARTSGGSGPGSWSGGASGGAAGNRARTAVQVETLETGTVSTYIITNGEILAGTEVEVYSDVAGKIVRFSVSEGDYVREGQTLAMVDPSRPGESYSASPVVAPVSGTVTSVLLTRGDTVSTQSPVAVISDLSDLKMEIYVPERYVGQLKTGLPAIAGFEAFPGQDFEAMVSRLSPVLDQASRTLRVELVFAKRYPGIKAGMFAGIRLITDQRKDVPIVPREAVLTSAGGYAVYVVTATNGQELAEKRTVELGLRGKEKVEILSGLEVGDSVVVKGQNFLSDGDQVRIIPGEES